MLNFKKNIILSSLIYIFCFFFFPFAFSNAEAGRIKLPESAVKASFLYNFAKFVEWPANTFDTPDTPIILCILGDNSFGDDIEIIGNKKVRNRILLVRHLQNLRSSIGELINSSKCHILYIDSSEIKNLSMILSEISGLPCLTVSDIKDFAHLGGMIGLFKQNNKIHFEINMHTTKMSGMTISSRLLKLARIIDENTVRKP